MEEVERRYHQALTDLGVRKRWYQTATDLYYTAVISAVDGIGSEEILARSSELDTTLPSGHDLHLIKETLAAITAARNFDIVDYVATVEEVEEALRPATRSKRIRRVAGAIVVAADKGNSEAAAERVVALYHAWNERRRVRTGAIDLALAAITDSAGLDPVTALDRAGVVDRDLTATGYRNEWNVARILALAGSHRATERFLRLATEHRGRRRKPLGDRRHLLAIAALADLNPDDLSEVVSNRLESFRVGRFRPDHRLRLTVAALMTLGIAVPADERFGAVFHGFVIREHYVNSHAEAATSD